MLVTDSTVWIDLDRAGLVEEMFRLGHELRAPDVIIAELLEPLGSELVERGLIAVELTGAQVLEVERLVAQYPRPSSGDVFALEVAVVHRATLLTGDRALREAATRERVAVHGTLWVLDRMVEQKLLTPPLAAGALEAMVMRRGRFPDGEVTKRLNRWRRA